MPGRDVIDRSPGKDPASCIDSTSKSPLARIARGPELLGVGKAEEEWVPSRVQAPGGNSLPIDSWW